MLIFSCFFFGIAVGVSIVRIVENKYEEWSSLPSRLQTCLSSSSALLQDSSILTSASRHAKRKEKRTVYVAFLKMNVHNRWIGWNDVRSFQVLSILGRREFENSMGGGDCCTYSSIIQYHILHN